VHSFRAVQTFRAKPEKDSDGESPGDAIQKKIDELKKTLGAKPTEAARMDVDGDGREDLVLWHLTGWLDFKTDIYVYLRGPDQQLPARPTQVLIAAGSRFRRLRQRRSLNHDGVCKLVCSNRQSFMPVPSWNFSSRMEWIGRSHVSAGASPARTRLCR
jgi:hypothetical protein